MRRGRKLREESWNRGTVETWNRGIVGAGEHWKVGGKTRGGYEEKTTKLRIKFR